MSIVAIKDKYWLAFSYIDELPSTFVLRLYEYFEDIEKAWNTNSTDLKNIEGITRKQVEKFLLKRDKIDPDETLEYIQNRNINYLHFESSEYPFLLRQIRNPPSVLFYLGELSRCNFDKTLGVVGSRHATPECEKELEFIFTGLRNTDICIISGLALGVDTYAHRFALKNNISTIAVIGCGFDNLYPSINKGLAREIIENNGVIFSEYFPHILPISWRFPYRNRIVSGLSKGVLVVQAAMKSGAMITANLTLEQSRELMCLPGSILNPNTKGIYYLIKNGASIVTEPQDIFDILEWEKKEDNFDKQKQISFDFNDKIFKNEEEIKTNIKIQEEKGNKEKKQLTEFENRICEFIERSNPTFDEIVLNFTNDPQELMLILTNLELCGVIELLEGTKYCLMD